MQPVPDITAILGDLRWVLVGGIALRAYMPERLTQDVDLMIHADDQAAAQQAFAAAGYRLSGPLTIGGFTAHPPDDGPPIDILVSRASWLDAAMDQPCRDAAGLPVMPRPYLILLKLQAGRTQDLADVQRMLRDVPQDERGAIRILVDHEAADLVEDYDALVTLADLEFGG